MLWFLLHILISSPVVLILQLFTPPYFLISSSSWFLFSFVVCSFLSVDWCVGWRRTRGERRTSNRLRCRVIITGIILLYKIKSKDKNAENLSNPIECKEWKFYSFGSTHYYYIYRIYERLIKIKKIDTVIYFSLNFVAFLYAQYSFVIVRWGWPSASYQT